MTSLERGQLWVMRIHGAIGSVFLILLTLIPETVLAKETALPGGLVVGPVTLLLILSWLIMPGRRFRAWGYAHEPEELFIRHGVMTQVETVVPLFRVQHIDIGQGPIERAFGVNRLILHTAGTQHSKVELPGLSRATAERLRHAIRLRVAREAP